MNVCNLKYKIKNATEEEIYEYLKECNGNFNPMLSKGIDIRGYAKKIFKKSVTFEAWTGNTLIGLVAAYFNDMENLKGYITSVSLEKKYMGTGIASRLMNKCISYAKEHKFKEIKLRVQKDNASAIRLYKKFYFTDFENRGNFVLMKLTII